ncbi:STAS-like domain-containing protein [Sphingobacterium sp. SYP-B4668]|uniref:STAS-like domain-containing protein n=1 Tax=Sphingobacterium sp. SYP-B4668 TaxID=2996035 RepID=UPI0022DDB773|nr:DUF4325 domain-containing protein [Sphingobacterium sp. SYP-B4668]
MTTAADIKLKDLFNKSLDTRESVNFLMNHIEKELDKEDCYDIILDFTGIEFMSRSFADELHKQINSDTFKRSFTFENMPVGMIELLKIIEKTQTSRTKRELKSSVFVVKDISIIKDYTFSW